MMIRAFIDASVLFAAAIKAKCSHLVTYDRKHLIDPPQVAQQSGLHILIPTDLIQQLKSEQDE